MNKKKEELEKVRTGVFSRGWSLAKAGVRAGRLASSQFLSGDPEAFKQNLFSNVEALAKEMGQLKGSAMKVGQLLSTYGEHFLPPEVNGVLKNLQQRSPPLAWSQIEQRIREELGAKMNELEIDPAPVAAASIGQVHSATEKKNGRRVALKVQYPGVAPAIETDLKFLKILLSFSQVFPKGPRFDQIFSEVKEMLYQEVDYRNEFQFTKRFREFLADDPRYVVPEGVADYSTTRLMTTTFQEGSLVDSEKVAAISLERRNKLGLAFFELYLREMFEIGLVQTDPHLGNYKVRLHDDGADQLVLLDFGAVRAVPLNFQKSYIWLLRGVLNRDPEAIEKGGLALGLLQSSDPPELKAKYVELCLLIGEPFAGGVYDWGASDLPKRVAKAGSELAFNFKLRAPPRELVFLDRKLGGVFVFLSVLKCQLDARPSLAAIIEKTRSL